MSKLPVRICVLTLGLSHLLLPSAATHNTNVFHWKGTSLEARKIGAYTLLYGMGLEPLAVSQSFIPLSFSFFVCNMGRVFFLSCSRSDKREVFDT